MTPEPGISVHDSVTGIVPDDAGRVLVCGSHGGVFAATLAARIRPRAVILSDAGVGREQAGIAGLTTLEALGVAAVAIGHETARIGDGADLWRRGIVTHVNAVAARHGCAAGQDCAACARRLRAARPTGRLPRAASEACHLARVRPGEPLVWALDSASLVAPEHAGQVVVTGSHGALLGGRAATALKVDALAAVFNDAGVGIDRAGIGRLAALEARGIAAATVGHDTAAIGDGLASWREGIVSHVNRVAAEAGAGPGLTVPAWVARLLARRL